MKHRIATLLGGVLAGWIVVYPALAAPAINLAQTPLFLPGAVPPLNMLVMGKDHTLYYEAYNDASDLNGDNELDVGYKPARIDYFGYFDSHKCYTYDSGDRRYEPNRVTSDKRCGGANEWSGDFLNYVTTSRIDALRKVLYGGKRSTDNSSTTVLERSYIPQDAHSWGKEYTSTAVDGYDIRDYTPYSQPTAGNHHLFANTTPTDATTASPRLRVSTSQPYRIWEWVSIERPVAGSRVLNGDNGPTISYDEYRVRTLVCVSGLEESNCQKYASATKPTGLIQEFGEDDRMYFGLMTGSYKNNLKGGVLRKNVGSIKDEIDASTGVFTGANGLIKTIDNLKIEGFGTDYAYAPGWQGAWITTRPINNGEQPNWGNPLAEMLYETMRYFGDKGTPTSSYVSNISDGNDGGVNLPLKSWIKPFETYARCSAPISLAISDVNPSYDTDDIPGSYFNTFTGDVTGFSASTAADTIWQKEVGGTKRHFIGQSGADSDSAPTPKDVTSFSNIRGLSPEAPAKNGGYYSASAAYFGRTNDLSPANGKQRERTFSVALASTLPRIEIPVNGKTVTLVPFAKSVGGCLDIVGTKGLYQPTNQIVDFYVEQITPTYGKFRVNFEDVEQGADHDMDAIATYEYSVTATGEVKVTVTSQYAAGCIIQHMGYVISGTEHDGAYLVVRDLDTTGSAPMEGDVDYFLDTPPSFTGTPPVAAYADSVALPLTSTRTFIPGTSAGATVLKDPLWFAAKWGGFNDKNRNNLPDLQDEWDADHNGTPDNYFLVTNALKLSEQLRKAFETILSITSAASSVATNSTRLDTETLVYQARFLTGDWTGQLLAFPLNTNGTVSTHSSWDAADVMPTPAQRHIFTRTGTVPGTATGVEFLWANLTTAQKDALDLNTAGVDDNNGERRLNWLRGVRTDEKSAGGVFRNRSRVLGDIVNSDPQFVGADNFGYEALPLAATERDTYLAFRLAKKNTNGSVKNPMIYVGANDGMLHGFDASTGVERFAYVPSTAIPQLSKLTDPDYQHRYYVDGQTFIGDAYFNGAWRQVLVGSMGAGGRTVYALDVTDPTSFGTGNVLWEFTDPDLGSTLGQPWVVRMADGQWAAVFSNGYNSDSNKAVLYVVRLSDGTLIKKFDTGVGSAGTPNGLAPPAIIPDATRTVRAIYAGDLRGNLWKFDVSATSNLTWDFGFTSAGVPVPLFVARDSAGAVQPISAGLQIGRHPRGGYMVYFGTGKFFATGDNIVTSPQTQTFYGVWDKGTSSTAITYTATDRTTALTKQDILWEGTPTGSTSPVRLTTNAATDWDTKRGWYMDVKRPVGTADGERVVSTPIIRGGKVIVPTLIPPVDPCGGDGGSWLMVMDAVTGARLIDAPVDLNDDGLFTGADMVTTTIGGVTVTAASSGVRSLVGIIDSPARLSAGGTDIMIAGGSGGQTDTSEDGFEQQGIGSDDQCATSGGTACEANLNFMVKKFKGIWNRARGSWRQLR